MNAEQLWETTLNPDTRRLLRCRLNHDAAGDRAPDDQADGQGRGRPRRELMELHGDAVEVDI
jgi:topoisomerase-4 subunit B